MWPIVPVKDQPPQVLDTLIAQWVVEATAAPIVITLPVLHRNRPWHAVEIFSASWDGTGNEKDFVSVIANNGITNVSLGIVRENRVGLDAITVKGPLVSITLTKGAAFKGGSATVVKTRIQSGGEELRADGRLVKSRTVIIADGTTAIALPNGTERIQAEHELHINASAWAATQSAAVSEVCPGATTPVAIATFTADGDFPKSGQRRGSMTSLTVVVANIGANKIFLESWHRVPMT